MTRDAFGHEIEFGTIIRVSRPRRDGKYPVSFVFKSSGQRLNKIYTRAQLDQAIEDSRSRGVPLEIVGYRPVEPSSAGVPAKKTAAELDREIEEALRSSDRQEHGYDTGHISEREFDESARLEAKKYGLDHEEALQFVRHPRYLSIRGEVERWREQHGFPATNSSLTRGYLISRIRTR